MSIYQRTATLGKFSVRRKDRNGLALGYVKFSDGLGLSVFDHRDHVEFLTSNTHPV